jgi:hypothetical protein
MFLTNITSLMKTMCNTWAGHVAKIGNSKIRNMKNLSRNLKERGHLYGISLHRTIIFFSLSLSLSLWLYSPFDLGRFFSFLILCTVSRTPWTGDQPVARSLSKHITTQTQDKRTQSSMPWVVVEPTIAVFELAKTVHDLDRAATVTGRIILRWTLK